MKPSPLVVFYDGGCPLCRREIAHYRRCRGAERVDWVDIVAEPARLQPFGLAPDAAMRRFHVWAQGQWQIGVPGFLALWACLPGYRWLARVVTLLRLETPLQALYERFAARRFRRRCGNHCTPASGR